MGALTINRNKRHAEFQSSSPSGYGYDNPHVPKKLKLSNFRAPIKSSVSRLSQYPKQVTPISREVHAPCMILKGFTTNSKKVYSNSYEKSGQKMDNSGDRKRKLFLDYKMARQAAKSSCKLVDFEEKEDDIMEITDVEDGSGDSGVEEVAVVDNMKEDINKSGEIQTIRAKYRELDCKAKENLKFQPSTSSGIVSDLIDEKALESLSLNRRLDINDVDEGLPLHKKLFYLSSEKRDPQIRRLSYDIKLHEQKRALFKQLAPEKKDESVLVEPFRPLTEDDEEMVDNAFSNYSRRNVLVTHENSNITITGEVLRCLKPGAWLNDEVINVYLELLKEREKKEPKKFLKCHFFNTFFYKKLISGRTGYDYKSVRRWTTQRKLGYSLLECDKIFIPVHKEIHWCLAVINKKEEKFQYLDSLGGIDKQVMRVLAKYIVDEVKDKNGEDIDVSSWEQEYVTDLPNQQNGFDCGVFMIKYADFYSRDIGLCFKQEHMPYFRRRTAKEIMRLKAD